MSTRPLTATYRLQIHHAFPLDAATAIVPYLAELGVSHAYSAPLLRSRTGSVHGYDVVDPSALNPEVGDETARLRFIEALRARRLGLLLDIVPNHMAIGSQNRYWVDVLTHGRASPYARWFDIDWALPMKRLKGRVVLASLGEPIADALRDGKIRLALVDGRIRVIYGEQWLPLDPATLADVLSHDLGLIRAQLGARHPDIVELDEIIDTLASLPPRWTSRGDSDTAAERRASADAAAERLAALVARSADAWQHVERAAAGFGAGDAGAARLRALLDLQVYHLTYWRDGMRQLNYRRFFDVTELAGLRVGDPVVFDAAHRLILDWVADGSLDGLRIDHIDGLRDPAAYLARLRGELDRIAGDRSAAKPFIVVEKILSEGERLRESWPVSGTTGYEFLNDVESVLVDPAGRDALSAFHAGLAGARRDRTDFTAIAIACKTRVLESALRPDVDRVTRLLRRAARAAQIPEPDMPGKRRLRAVVVALAAALPVYRTYFGGAEGTHPDDVAVLDRALAVCRERLGVTDPEASMMRRLLADPGPPAMPVRRGARRPDPWREFVERFQQLSGPAAAKGIEDTALYRETPLASLCEVGGIPSRPLASAVEDLHRANAHRAAHWPGTLLAVTTHDTKRSADVRARLDTLSEMHERWIEAVGAWRRRHRAHAVRTGRRIAPDAVTEHLLYQSVLGIWPLGEDGVDRITAYMIKATREAKSRTSWLEPDKAFEDALTAFVEKTLTDRRFLAEMEALAAPAIRAGWWNALSRTLIHLASPGVPDLYQGDELWNLSLVDPDNRRPVDYERRAALLARPVDRRPTAVASLVRDAADGRVKLFVIHRVLHERLAHPELFTRGAYVPLRATGAHGDHVVAFARRQGEMKAIAIAPRLPLRFAGGEPPTGDRWGDTMLELPTSTHPWRCAFTGIGVEAGARALRLSDALGALPVGLFISGPDTAAP